MLFSPHRKRGFVQDFSENAHGAYSRDGFENPGGGGFKAGFDEGLRWKTLRRRPFKRKHETRVPAEDLKNYVGGRGLAAKIAWDRLGAKWENVDPLGPENILLVLTGPLTGY